MDLSVPVKLKDKNRKGQVWIQASYHKKFANTTKWLLLFLEENGFLSINSAPYLLAIDELIIHSKKDHGESAFRAYDEEQEISK